jgi:hypothetical protein
VRIEQVGGDRLVLSSCAAELAASGAPCCSSSRAGHANLLLLGPEDRLVDWLVPAPAGRAAARLALGSVWKPPAGARRAPGRGGPAIAEALPEPEDAAPGADGACAPLSWRVERALGLHADEGCERASSPRDSARGFARKIERTRALVAGWRNARAPAAEVERVRQTASS